MGVSTDAILFFGFSAEDEEAWSEVFGEKEWEDKLAEKKGLLPPAEAFSEKTRDAHREYWTKKEELVRAQGCDVGYHCSGDYPIPYVAIQESVVTAYRGSVKEVMTLEVKPGWRDQLKEFCTLLDIPWQEPKWYLVSYWG